MTAQTQAEPAPGDAFAADPDALPRDWLKRPLVFPFEGGKRKPFTRCTTYVGGLEDTYRLGKWQQRHVALGLADRPDLLKRVDAWRDNRDELDRICDEARDAAGANDAATRGTLMHTLTERADKGETVEAGDGVPSDCIPDLAAYIDATSGLEAVSIEQFTVLDALAIGGTPDRVVRYKGQRYIADLKTGDIEYGALKIAAQLAVYARSNTYDVRGANALGTFASREQAKALRGLHGASVERGIVIHCPARTGTCSLYWIDLLLGWRAVNVSRDVREQRRLKYADVISDFDTDPEPRTVQGQLDVASTREPATLAEQVLGCADRETLAALWKLNTASWTDELTTLAKQHLEMLAGLGQPS